MLFRKYRGTIAFLLALCLSEVIVPGYFLHLIIHHHETDHVHCSISDSEQIGPEHEHCTLLEFSVPAIEFFYSYSVPELPIAERVYYKPCTFVKVSPNFLLPSLRGPPQV